MPPFVLEYDLQVCVSFFYINIKFLQYMFTYSTDQCYTTAQHYRDNNMRSKFVSFKLNPYVENSSWQPPGIN